VVAADPTTRPPDAAPAPRRPRRRADVAAALALGLGGAVVLAASGSPAWGAARAVLAAVLGAALAGLHARALATPTPAAGRLADRAGVVVGALALPAAGVLAGDRLGAGRVVPGSAAVLAAAAAAVLLVLGTVRRVRAVRGWRRLLALPVALAVLQLVVAPVGLAVLTTNTSPQPLGDVTPADRGLAHEDVLLVTPDGTELAAWWVPGASGTAVLLLHGSGSTRAATLDHAAALAELGHGVLMVDARGHGASGGTGMALGWHGARDLAVAVDWLDAREDVARICAVGLSMGGEVALTLAARDPRVGAVVAEGTGVRVAADVAEPGWFPHLVDTWTYALTDLLTAADPPPPLRDVVAGLRPNQRALLVAGAGEGTQAAWYAAAAPDRVAVWDVPDAGHTQALAAHPEEWSARVGTALAGAGDGQ
jgi:pimeloyl-ACP methyl ester carboxylesterase